MFLPNADEPFADLTAEQRARMIEVLDARSDMYGMAIECNEMMIDYLSDPKPETKQKLQDFIEEQLKPLIDAKKTVNQQLWQDAVDMTKLKEALPMAVLALVSAVNLPLLLTYFDFNAKQVSGAIRKLSEFIENGD